MRTDCSQPLRIVHACNFHYNKSGENYDTMDQKIHQGLGENRHYVYPFPVHDIARQLSWTNSKGFDPPRRTIRSLKPAGKFTRTSSYWATPSPLPHKLWKPYVKIFQKSKLPSGSVTGSTANAPSNSPSFTNGSIYLMPFLPQLREKNSRPFAHTRLPHRLHPQPRPPRYREAPSL